MGPRDPHALLVFFVNGKKVEDNDVNPEWTLLQYLRTKLGLCGTKLGCGEGGCGACTVMVSKYVRSKKKVEHMTVNACLAPIVSLHGQSVTTVEGIGSARSRVHPVQERIAKAHGSQCGFCTPGIVMSMYTLLRKNPQPTIKEIEDNFQGNLCRCTGYRPILQGFQTFTAEGCCGGGTVNGCCMRVQKDGDMVSGLFDAKEFATFDPSQEPIFPAELQVSDSLDSQFLAIRSKSTTWYRPLSLQHLLELKNEFPNSKIVVGNTEIGIETKFKGCNYPVLIDPSAITEMKQIKKESGGITIGASVSLSSIQETLGTVIKQESEEKTRIFAAILEMLHWFGGPQVRNVACIGGNVATASPISDLNPLLVAAGATLNLAEKGKSRTVVMDESFFTSYRKTLLKPTEVLISATIPYSKKNEYFFGFKQAQRREDDIAIVNAGMFVAFEDGTNIIHKLKLAFGGVAATTVVAEKTINTLIGREWRDDLLADACRFLADDLPIDPGAPGGMVQYRRTLINSFFFKFYMKVLLELHRCEPGLSESLVPEGFRSACAPFHKDPPKASQLYQIVAPGQLSDDPIGRPIPVQSSLQQATGEAVYCDDLPRYSGELFAAFVMSCKAHAKLLSIDASQALAVEGVHTFLSAQDLPASNNWCGIEPSDEEVIFADGKVMCQGQIIGAIIAENKDIAQKAAKMVQVEYEDLKPIITIEDAIASNSYLHTKTMSCGDVEAGFADSDHVLEGEVRIGGQEHFYLETHCAIAVPRGEHEELDIVSATQSPYHTQMAVAKVLGIPANRVVVKTKRLGGAFGGKDSRPLYYSSIIALAAKKLNRPVRFMMDRDEDMAATGGRHPYLFRYKVGFNNDGKLVALQAKCYSNAGCTHDYSAYVLECTMVKIESGYRIPHVDVAGFACKTNLPSNTAFRAFGTPQGKLLTESIVEEVAAFLRMDVFKVREINLVDEGHKTYYGDVLVNCTLGRCWEECIRQSNYWPRQQSVQQFNRENRWKKRGLSLVPICYGIGFGVNYLCQGAALVHIYTDGTVLLTHGGVEMGQGLHTKLLQIASRALCLPQDQIHISETSTDKVPNATQSAGSYTTDLVGPAVLNACKIIMGRLEKYMHEKPKGSWKEWIHSAYMDRVSLSATGFNKDPYERQHPEELHGDRFKYYSYGAACSEVEIDCLTGDHQVLRTDIVMDVGESLNPAVDIGQIEGAFIQGYGLYTLEELRYSPDGFLLTRGPGTYKIPSFGDIPSEFHVSLLKGSPNVHAIYSSKAIGEPPLIAASSVFCAIKDAITTARAEVGVEGPFRLDSPATAERIRMACTDQFTQQFSKPEEGSFKPWSIVV